MFAPSGVLAGTLALPGVFALSGVLAALRRWRARRDNQSGESSGAFSKSESFTQPARTFSPRMKRS